MNLSPRDFEQLSAYLDDALSPADRAALDARLASDSSLREELSELRATVRALRALPSLRPPRRYTLTPEMAKRPWTLPSFTLPTLRFATALTAAAFVFVAVKDFNAARQFAAPAAPESLQIAAVEAPPADVTESLMEAQAADVTESPMAEKSAAPTESTAEIQQLAGPTETALEEMAPSLAPEEGGGGRSEGGGGEGDPGVGGGGGGSDAPPVSVAPPLSPATTPVTEVAMLDPAIADSTEVAVAPPSEPPAEELVIQAAPPLPEEPPANPWRPFSIGLGALALALAALVILTRRAS